MRRNQFPGCLRRSAGRGLSGLFGVAAILLAGWAPADAQGGKEFLQWLKEYSPTGYFIINDYETRANKPGDHKQWLTANAAAPMPGVAVHETCHMRDGLNSKSGYESIFVGLGIDYSIKRDFQPFNSKEIMADIPDSMVNFQTDVYISNKANTNAYSQEGGLIGIMGEYNAYIAELKSGVELAACIKANFNTRKNWDDLGNDMTTAVWSNSEFRYFCLRYILMAKRKYPATYTTITTGENWRKAYTLLVHYAEPTLDQWKAVLEAQNMDTRTENGFDWYWKFWNEIQKPEYKDLEKIMLLAPTGVSPYLSRPRAEPPLLGGMSGRFDLTGRLVPGRGFSRCRIQTVGVAR